MMVHHQSWFMQRSKIQLLGLNIVCLSLQHRQPFSKMPMALSHLFLGEIALPLPQALITHPSGSCHSPGAANAAQDALSPLNSCSRRCGEEEPGQGKWEWNEERWWDELERRREKACFPFLWPWPWSVQDSPLWFLYPLGPSRAKFPAFSCTH